jgi:hypothetical protein
MEKKETKAASDPLYSLSLDELIDRVKAKKNEREKAEVEKSETEERVNAIYGTPAKRLPVLLFSWSHYDGCRSFQPGSEGCDCDRKYRESKE